MAEKRKPKKLPKGVQVRVADALGVTATAVSLVAAGKRKSARISEAIAAEMARMSGKRLDTEAA